jgi:hypothetical protein
MTSWTIAQLVPSFLVPGLAAAGAAAVSIPIIIHILSRRPRRPEPWAAMRFLLAAYRKHRVRTRLEQWILLAMRCLLVLLLGAALAGPVWSAAGSLAGLGGGRTFVIVLDDSITSGALDAAGHSRFQTLKDVADKLLASLKPGDKAALIAASRPARPVISPPTVDPMAVRNHIRELQPTVAAADLPEALLAARECLRQADGPAGRAYIVLLSDFSAGATRLDAASSAALPKELNDLGQFAVLLMNEPLPATSNVQVVALEPDRRVVLPLSPGQSPAVNWTTRLRRMGPDSPPASLTTVRLTVAGAAAIRRPVRWEAGQMEAEIAIPTPIREGGLFTAEVELEPAAEGEDTLIADNSRRALVQVRQRLTVMLVGDESLDESPLSSRQWLTTALAPVSDRLGWPIEVRPIDAPSVGAAVSLSEADAVIVLRPDELDGAGFEAIKRWTEAGGLAWFITPSAPRSPLWTQEVASAFGLPWSIGQDPMEHSDAPLRLQVDAPATGELVQLSAELPDLLSPIEITRRLWIDPASLGSGADLLLVGEGGEPVLVGAATQSGAGRVLLLAVAIDPAWSNLPAKPLIVPLMHEVLRAAINRLQPPQEFEPGDQPVLAASWDRASKLTAPDGQTLLLVRGSASSAAERPVTGGAGVRPIRPFQLAGVYKGDTDALVVNVNSQAADTRSTDPVALGSYLSAAGGWQSLDLVDPAASLQTAGGVPDLTRHLLWIVLGLAVIETLFARLVSHASTTDRTASVVELGSRRAA